MVKKRNLNILKRLKKKIKGDVVKMGLITKTVIMKWTSSNTQWYKAKGYDYNGYFEEFEVKAEDLTHGSKVSVEVKCDCEDCKSPYIKTMIWQNYNKYKQKDGKYICNNCIKRSFETKENQRRANLKRSISFEQWCYDNLDIDYANEILSRWDYEKNISNNGNIINPNSITFRSEGINGKGYWFKCLKHNNHVSEQKGITDFINKINKQKNSTILECKQCSSFGQYLLNTYGENGIKNYWSYKNVVNPFEISYGNHQKVWIKCQEKDYHEDYDVKCKDFSTKESRCPYCNSTKVHPLDSLGKLLEDSDLSYLWSENNDSKSPYEYSLGARVEKVWWKCECGKHEDYKRNILNSKTNDFKCPECVRERKESFLQEKVRIYLNELGYELLHEHNCSIVPINPKTKRHLPYDNEVIDMKLICEVMGKQHYEICTWHESLANKNNTTPENELHIQQVRDRYKRIFAKKQGYFYVDIPYWTEKNKSYKKLIDNKIKEIINNNVIMESDCI